MAGGLLINRQVYAEQVALLYGHAPMAYTITLVNGLILIFMQRAHIPITVLLTWFACLAVVMAGRIILAYRYSRAKPSLVEACRWGWGYFVGALLPIFRLALSPAGKRALASCGRRPRADKPRSGVGSVAGRATPKASKRVRVFTSR